MKSKNEKKNLTGMSIFELEAVFSAASVLPGYDYRIAVARNFRVTKEMADDIRGSAKAPEAFIELQTEIRKLQEPICAKGEDGRPALTKQGLLTFEKENIDEANEIADKINKKHPKVVSEREKQMKDYLEGIEKNKKEVELLIINEKWINKEFLDDPQMAEKTQGIVEGLDKHGLIKDYE